jgi:hypothetical protein
MAATTAALAATAPHVFAQKASVTYYGKACNDAPPFTVIGLPQLGTTFQFETLSGHRMNSVSFATIMAGVSDKVAFGKIPLPFNLDWLSGGGDTLCGLLLQSFDVSIPVPSVSGIPQLVRVPIQVPNDTRLLGATVYFQAYRQWGLPGTAFIYSTRGAKLVAGR